MGLSKYRFSAKCKDNSVKEGLVEAQTLLKAKKYVNDNVGKVLSIREESFIERFLAVLIMFWNAISNSKIITALTIQEEEEIKEKLIWSMKRRGYTEKELEEKSKLLETGMRSLYTIKDSTGLPLELVEKIVKEVTHRKYTSGIMKRIVSIDNYFSINIYATKRVKLEKLLDFTNTLQTQLDNDVPVLDALYVTREYTNDKKLRLVIDDIINDISEGKTLYEAFSRHKATFPPIYVPLMKLADKTSFTARVLEDLSVYIERLIKFNGEMKKAIAYPSIVLVLLMGVLMVLAQFAIPTYKEVYMTLETQGIEMRELTKLTFALADNIGTFALILLACVFIIYILVIRFSKVRNYLGMKLDNLMVRIKMLNSISNPLNMFKISTVLELSLKNDLSLLEAMDLAYGTVNNSLIKRELSEVKRKIESGRNIAEAFKESMYICPVFKSSIGAGASAGNFDPILGKTTRYYIKKIDNLMSEITKAMAPVLLVIVGIVISVAAVGLLAPLKDIYLVL